LQNTLSEASLQAFAKLYNTAKGKIEQLPNNGKETAGFHLVELEKWAERMQSGEGEPNISADHESESESESSDDSGSDSNSDSDSESGRDTCSSSSESESGEEVEDIEDAMQIDVTPPATLLEYSAEAYRQDPLAQYLLVASTPPSASSSLTASSVLGGLGGSIGRSAVGSGGGKAAKKGGAGGGRGGGTATTTCASLHSSSAPAEAKEDNTTGVPPSSLKPAAAAAAVEAAVSELDLARLEAEHERNTASLERLLTLSSVGSGGGGGPKRKALDGSALGGNDEEEFTSPLLGPGRYQVPVAAARSHSQKVSRRVLIEECGSSSAGENAAAASAPEVLIGEEVLLLTRVATDINTVVEPTDATHNPNILD
jgi:hypothetical protein